MFAISALSEIAVKATQITGLAAGREYLRFFFNRVGCISRLYRRHGAITALGRGAGSGRWCGLCHSGPEDFAGDDFAAFPIYGCARDTHRLHRRHLHESALWLANDRFEAGSKLFRQRSARTDPRDGSFSLERIWLINGAADEEERPDRRARSPRIHPLLSRSNRLHAHPASATWKVGGTWPDCVW
jgi:hypothetical protein